MISHGSSHSRSVGLNVTPFGLLWLAFVPLLQAAPSGALFSINDEESGGEPVSSPTMWIDFGVALFLVLLGGAFAGLTIALMGQDAVHLQVIATSGEGSERKNAAKVLRLLERGKHWVLVTLLLGNVVTNETLPIVLDRSLGGGWAAVLGSTVLIVIFGEVIPQSVCVRYGLPIGANLSWVVVGLMYIFAPVAWPTAKLLDYLLGENHGTVYKKAGLKTLVTLHKSLGTRPAERLNHDEVTIITAVLDLKAKSLRSIMTPIKELFILSSDSVLDEETMDVVLHSGFSRIPIHAPNEPLNFVGMLLVKMLITYDPEDAKQVKDFAIATLPEALPEISCLDIINYFQEGKSHMVLVSEEPGENRGALGVVTLEDVIEELIGEEITDESDFPGGIPKPIRRATLTPIIGQVGDVPPPDKTPPSVPANDHEHRRSSLTISHSRRLEALSPEQRRHFDHLGPANLASKPNKTHSHNVVIKHGQNEGGDPAPHASEGVAASGGTDENTPLLSK